MPNNMEPPLRNELLMRLSEQVCARVRPGLMPIALARGMVVYRHDARPEYVYFPRSGVISLSCVLKNGDRAEIAIVGSEGFVGMPLMMDGQGSPMRAVVQSPGEAWAMRVAALRDEFRLGGEFQWLMLRYTQALMAQMAQVTLCTRRHRVAQQLCRWLLLAFDRVGDDELQLTHEAVAEALGVRREGITDAMGQLEEQGGIRRSRGRIRMLDRDALMASSCECYGVVRDEYRRLLEDGDEGPSRRIHVAAPPEPRYRYGGGEKSIR